MADGKVIEMPNAPKVEKQLVEAKQYLLTEEERQIVLALCDSAVKQHGLTAVANVLKIVNIFNSK